MPVVSWKEIRLQGNQTKFLYLPSQMRFPIGGKCMRCRGSKLSNFIGHRQSGHFSQFWVAAFSQTSDIRRNVLRKFREPSMGPPFWWSSLLNQNGCLKMVQTSKVYVGYLGDWLSKLNRQAFTKALFLTHRVLKRLKITKKREHFSTNAIGEVCYPPL